MIASEASNNAGVEWDRGNPARRCVATKRTGERCRNWAIRGATVCRYHGGSTRHIKRAAAQRLNHERNLYMVRQLVRRTVHGADLYIPEDKRRVAFAVRDKPVEVVDGPKTPPSAAVDGAERPGLADAPDDESAPTPVPVPPPPRSLNQEEAAAVMRESRLRNSPVRRRRRTRRPR